MGHRLRQSFGSSAAAVWLRLPDRCPDADVAAACAARHLTVSPGRAFFAGEPPAPYLRLSYAATQQPGLVRAAEILAKVIAPG